MPKTNVSRETSPANRYARPAELPEPDALPIEEPSRSLEAVTRQRMVELARGKTDYRDDPLGYLVIQLSRQIDAQGAEASAALIKAWRDTWRDYMTSVEGTKKGSPIQDAQDSILAKLGSVAAAP